MRNMSYALTEPQVLDQSKDVTRRLGWLHAKDGEIVQPVRKGMGLRPGEKIVKVGAPVRILFKRRERLDLMEHSPDYGLRECRREGFPDMEPAEFVTMFCATHRRCQRDTVITRIEFSYDLLDGWQGMHSAPKDGTHIELLIRHFDWLYAAPADRHRWQAPCRAHWINFNGGGWTWVGIMGDAIAWRPA
jgi:hypothetical protein